MDMLLELLVFSAKALVILLMVLGLFAGILALAARGKIGSGQLKVTDLNQKFRDRREALYSTILPKSQFKKWLKDENKQIKEKNKKAEVETLKNIFVIDFNGDIKASAVSALREEVTAILSIAKKQDEVLLRLESPGGMVHAYGLAAAQLARLRDHGIPLTVSVDKVAASGGYLMACVANRILAAPFAILGSIGVIVQMPNFHRALKNNHIDFEQLTAGNYKRTLTVFGQNTEEGREKLQQEIEEIHELFKTTILGYRSHLDIQKVSTGEHWLGKQAIDLQLVDALQTSDDYLMSQLDQANLYELAFQTKKSWGSKLMASARLWQAENYGSSLLMK